jgi:hypothetical protein
MDRDRRRDRRPLASRRHARHLQQSVTRAGGRSRRRWLERQRDQRRGDRPRLTRRSTHAPPRGVVEPRDVAGADRGLPHALPPQGSRGEAADRPPGRRHVKRRRVRGNNVPNQGRQLRVRPGGRARGRGTYSPIAGDRCHARRSPAAAGPARLLGPPAPPAGPLVRRRFAAPCRTRARPGLTLASGSACGARSPCSPIRALDIRPRRVARPPPRPGCADRICM